MIIQRDNIELNYWGLFDATLHHRQTGPEVANAELQICLRIFLEPINEGQKVIGDGEKGHKFKIDNWPPETWRKFKEAYVNTGAAFWDQRFWLKTPEHFTRFDYNAGPSETYPDSETIRENKLWGSVCKDVPRSTGRYEGKKQMIRPNIDCRFKIFLVDVKYSDKTSIKVNYITHRLAAGKWKAVGEGKLTHYRSNSTTYSQSDILEEDMYYKGAAIRFQTHLHELGHTMGLQHAAFVRGEDACIEKVKKEGANGKNADVCYASSEASASAVMGLGKAISEYEALAWQVAAESLTGVRREEWKVSLSKIFPDFV